MPNNKSSELLQVASHFANIAVAVAVIITAIFASRQLSEIREQVVAAHQQTGMDTLWRLHDRLTSQEMQSELAKLPAIHKPATADDFLKHTVLSRLANFYEMVALSVNKNYIPFEDVNRYIGSDILEFWSGVDGAIAEVRRREKRPWMFAELEQLVRRIERERGYPLPSTAH